ncbi:MAG: radical SAM protein [Bacteroidota bacterium]
MIPKAIRLKAWAAYCRLEEPKLRTLFWETTLRCNLSCRHCGSDCQKQDYPGELSTEEVLDAFSQIKEAYDPRSIMISVSGGEPLLRGDLFPVMKAARRMGFRWGMTTNGFLVDERIVEQCLDAGMDTVSISLDGLEEAHNDLRQHPQSFERATRALKLFADSKGLACVQATTCVTPKSLEQLGSMLPLVQELGCDSWRIMNIFPYGRADKDLTLPPEGLKRMLAFIEKQRQTPLQNGLGKPMTVTYSDEGFLGCRFEGAVRSHLYTCQAGISVASILHDGDIGACNSLPRHLAQGNIRRDRFVDVWENRYQLFRDRRWMKQGACKKCSWWSNCLGNSLHLWDHEKQAPAFCHYRMLKGIKQGDAPCPNGGDVS